MLPSKPRDSAEMATLKSYNLDKRMFQLSTFIVQGAVLT